MKTSMSKKTNKPKIVSAEEIRNHKILSSDDAQVVRALAAAAREQSARFTMLDFADVRLRATARDFGEASDPDDAGYTMHLRDLKKAAILFVYEALKNADMAIIKEYPEIDNALDLLYWLSLEVS